MRAVAVLMLLPIIKSSSRDSARSLPTAFNSQRPTRMGRRQAAKADGGGIGREEDFKATASNPRGLDARAFTKKTGAPDECALDTS
jgi:hypothetical protein